MEIGLGPQLFKVSTTKGEEGPTSHVGILDFTAPSGTIGIPSWVMHNHFSHLLLIDRKDK